MNNLDQWCAPPTNGSTWQNATTNTSTLTNFMQAIFLCSLNNRAVSRKEDARLYREFEAKYLRWAIFEVCGGENIMHVEREERYSQRIFSGLLK